MISRSAFNTMPARARGYYVGRYLKRRTEAEACELARKTTANYLDSAAWIKWFIHGWKEGMQARKECGE